MEIIDDELRVSFDGIQQNTPCSILHCQRMRTTDFVDKWPYVEPSGPCLALELSKDRRFTESRMIDQVQEGCVVLPVHQELEGVKL